MQQIQDQVSALSRDEFSTFLSWVVSVEKPRRDAQPAVDEANTKLITDLQEQGKLDTPEAMPWEPGMEVTPDNISSIPAWSDPGTDHTKMYHSGDVVTRNQRVWRSNHPFLNHWGPGDFGVDDRIWEDITPQWRLDEINGTAGDDPQPGDGVKDYVQPTGAHDAYQKGAVVRFTDGHVYESLINNNTWSPEAYPQGWRRVD